jgi:hypothetical protein
MNVTKLQARRTRPEIQVLPAADHLRDPHDTVPLCAGAKPEVRGRKKLVDLSQGCEHQGPESVADGLEISKA